VDINGYIFMETDLYLLIGKDYSKFKIGLTIDVAGRANELTREWGDFDFSESYTITGDSLTISRLERSLHFMFSAWNIKNESDRAGRTEWFKIDCLDEVRRTIERISKLQGSTRKLVKGVILHTAKIAVASHKSSYLADILFKEYRYRVLCLLLLQPGIAYHVREIARLTKTVPGTLNRELKALAKSGILLTEKIGNQVSYRANTDCKIFNEIESILRKI